MTSKKLLSDTMYYALIQASNFALPLITLPYITRVIGVEKFGVLELALVFTNFFVLLVKYGFDYTATRDIATSKSDNLKVSNLFYSYFFSKILIFLVAIVIFSICAFFSESIQENFLIFFLTFMGVFADFLLPSWLYRGMGDVRFVALLSFFVKLLFLPLVFIFIVNEEDYFYRPLLMSFLSIVVAVFSVLYAMKKYSIKKCRINILKSIYFIKISTPMFLVSCFIFFSGAFNIVVIDFLGLISAVDLGNFSAAQKVIQIVQNVIVLSVSQVFYPFFVTSFVKDESKFGSLVLITSIYLSFVGFFIGIILYFLSDLITSYLFGSGFIDSASYIRYLAFLPLFTLLTNLFLIQGVSGMGRDASVMIVNFLFFIINAATLVWVYSIWSVEGLLVQRNILQMVLAFFGCLMFIYYYRGYRKVSSE